jgi:urease subunit alpha
MAAEGPLHELGAIAIVNSDSQGMGRMMETVRRTIQLAHVMKAWRRSPAGAGHAGMPDESGDAYDDTSRILRYVAKFTLEPAITHGLSDHVGSLRAGRLADIVLWKPAFFGVKPELVLKSGYPAWATLGDGNASVERAEPTRYRPDWGGSGRIAASLGITFVAPGMASVVGRRQGGRRSVVEIGRTRGLSRSDLAMNRATAAIAIDVGDGRVSLAGRALAVEPAAELPLNRRYLLR